MKTQTSWAKRIVAMLLAVTMVISMVGCGKRAETDAETGKTPVSDASPDKLPTDYDREDMELIVDLVGNGQSTDGLSDKELGDLVDDLISNMGDQSSNATDLGSSTQVQKPETNWEMNEGVYDENGAMTKPFDQVYPDLIEQEQVAFSGESILIKLASAELTDSLKAAGVAALEEIVPLGDCAWYEAMLTEGADAKDVLSAVRELDEVLLAEYNYEVEVADLDDYKHFDKDKDEEFKKNGHNKDQWHFHHCGIVDGYEAMETNGGDSSVVVAVIDSGVDYDHEDLKDNMWVNTGETPNNGIDDDGNGYIDDYYGVDIVAGKGNGDDTNGHGTHVAGIIAARNNNVGVLGIAYNVKIMSVKAAAHNGTLSQSDIAKAVLYAAQMGAEVINMSFGGTACSIAVQDALADAYTRCVLVASAGNSGKPNQTTDYYPALPNYPAGLTYVLGVMSVDDTGVESGFTNWDAIAYNGVEYELYAPGENIMSTLPDNQYGYLSGTSMAAPVVSAFAAILRSEFADRDKYPTEFIYGQLASTSGNYAECVDPEKHTVNGKLHNLPQIANLYDALTKLPKPEVNLQDYALFDDPKYSDKNNGDGVIDAGETIALGLTLRNRWGMSENTIVTIDTISDASGREDPYITIHNSSVNYGSVGTYSTRDCGKIVTDGMHTGWENPFLITIAEDCPNDYRFTLNVNISCENALDEADETIYITDPPASINEAVRNGVVLPAIIEEDMTLTKDNIYIIPSATVIQAGITVRVEPGTHIQFWSDDPDDPYAEGGIAFLQVDGKFLVEGTKEDPVYIYPSELKSDYVVKVNENNDGEIRLSYADITNLHFDTGLGSQQGITYAGDCTFRRSTYGSLTYRVMSNGSVYDATVTYSNLLFDLAERCVFYKIGNIDYPYIELIGAVDTCIFVDCELKLSATAKNSVFLGNTIQDQIYSNEKDPSTLTMKTQLTWKAQDFNVYYRPETGTTYVKYRIASGWNEDYSYDHLLFVCLNERFSGTYAVIETEEERDWLVQSGIGHARLNIEKRDGKFWWSDGTEVGAFLLPEDSSLSGKDRYTFATEGKLNSNGSEYHLYEIPGRILPEDITFREYTVTIDQGVTLQLAPISTPIPLPADQFIYESDNTDVLTVSETGLVTPVATGTADVWVWSMDRAVKNRITITVGDYVALTGLAFPTTTMRLQVGTSANVPCVLTPADTTRRNVTYTSSNPDVVQVDYGLITAVGQGTATVTATCEGFTATMEVRAEVWATWIAEETYLHEKRIEDGDTSLPKLVVTPANADLDLEWTSGDESIFSVENGKLLIKKEGAAYLYVTDKISGLEATFRIKVAAATPPVIEDDVIAVQLGADPVALPEATMAPGAEVTPVWTVLDPAVAEIKDGAIYVNGAGLTTLRLTDPRNNQTDEIFIYVTEEVPRIKEIWNTQNGNGNDYYLALTEDGKVYYWGNYQYSSLMVAPELTCENAKAIGLKRDGSNYYTVVLDDNTAMPYNAGERVVSATHLYHRVTYLVLPEEMEPVCVIGQFYTYEHENTTYADGALHVLDEDGKVYAIGNNKNGQLGVGSTEETVMEVTQVPLNEKVIQIAGAGSVTYYLTEEGNLYISGGTTMKAATPVLVARNVTWLDESGVGFVSKNNLYIFTESATAPTLRRNDDLSGYRMLDADDYYLANTSSAPQGVMEKNNELYNLYTFGRVISGLSSVKDATYTDRNNSRYVLTEEGLLFAYGGPAEQLWNMSREDFDGMRALFQPLSLPEATLSVLQNNLSSEGVLTEDTLALRFNKQLLKEAVTISENGMAMTVNKQVNGEMLYVKPSVGWADGKTYCITVSAADTRGIGLAAPTEDIVIEFTYQAPEAPQPEEPVQPEENLPEVTPEEPVIYETIVDQTVERVLTAESLVEKLDEYMDQTQYNPDFSGNAILNRIYTDSNVEHWLRLVAPTASTYTEIPVGGNYWGTVNEMLIGKQLVDYADMPTYARLMYAPYLTQAPENTFPFVTDVKLFNKAGEEVTTVGNEEITFRVTFNRDMDTDIPLLVRFGSAYPYGDYEVAGAYVDARTWEGTYTLNTLIENGNQYFTISNGCAATDDLELQLDRQRFGFSIDTTAAQALIMQATALDTGIELKWTQDDFDTLMGYNVYRSTAEDGLYTRLNSTVIPADTMTWFDDTVEPGVVYYYNFTVVQTDLTESQPSGKVNVQSRDTMAPNIYPSPVASAFTGANLVLSATITDNLNIAYANIYYRVAGTEEWIPVRMNKLNDRYSAIVPAANVTLAGVEYYIEAFDGVSFTYKGSAEEPLTVVVQEAIDANALGDVDGDGVISIQDALLLLYAINDKYNMNTEEFARADLNGDEKLEAAEALRILQYVNGVVGSVKM